MSIYGDFTIGNIVIGGGEASSFPEHKAGSQGFQPAMPGKFCCTGLFANSGNGYPEFSVCLYRVLLGAPGNKPVNLPAFLLEHPHVVGAALGIVCNSSVLVTVPLAVLVKLGEVNGCQTVNTVRVAIEKVSSGRPDTGLQPIPGPCGDPDAPSVYKRGSFDMLQVLPFQVIL